MIHSMTVEVEPHSHEAWEQAERNERTVPESPPPYRACEIDHLNLRFKKYKAFFRIPKTGLFYHFNMDCMHHALFP